MKTQTAMAIVNWTDGPLAGDNLVVVLDTSVAAEATGQIGDAFVLLMQNVGVQINLRPLQGPAANDATTTGTWEMRVDRIGQEYTTSFTRCQGSGAGYRYHARFPPRRRWFS